MTQQNLDFGTAAPNDGEKMGTAFAKIQANFAELYGKFPVVTADITDAAVTYAKIQNGTGLSVLGRSTNSGGVNTDIIGMDGQVLRVSGTVLGFGSIATAGITDAAVTYAKIANVAGLSVMGRSANSSGVPADIVGIDGQVLRVSGTALGFGTVATAGHADASITYAKIQNIAGLSVMGRSTNSSGVGADITGADKQILRVSGTTLGFGAIDLSSTSAVSGTLGIGNGGTGIANPTAHDLLIGNGSSAMTQLAPSATSGIPLVSQGASANPAYGTAVVAGGGTGLTSTTAYAVLCGGTTSTGALQSIAGVGTAGQILTSNGAGALPTFQTVASTGGTVLLTSGTVSAAATLDIVLTGYTGYRGYRGLKIYLSGFLPATDGVFLYIRFSTDGGASYDATGYQYAGGDIIQTPAQGTFGSASAAQIQTTSGAEIGNASTEGTNLEATLLNQTSAAFFTRIFGVHCYMNNAATSAIRVSTFGGARSAAQDTDAIRFLFSSGNIASGNYAVYGLV